MDLKKKKTEKTKEPGQRKLSSLLALDFATSGIKAVRLKKVKGTISLTGVELLPAVDLDAGEHPDIPKTLSAYYAALCTSAPNAHLRVFSHAPQDGEVMADVVKENLSLSGEYRTAGKTVLPAKGKREASILGVAIPQKVVGQFLDIFANGAPAPHSLELSGLSAFSAFFFNRGKQTANQTICLIETGKRFTYVAFFHHNQLQIINRFDTGGESLLQQVQIALSVDEDMARTILSGGSVDVSGPVRKALGPFTKQLSIYKEFVERQNKTALSGVYLSGGEARSPHWSAAVEEVLGFAPVVWDPFEKIELPSEGFPEELRGQEPRFAAAVGAALAGMEAS